MWAWALTAVVVLVSADNTTVSSGTCPAVLGPINCKPCREGASATDASLTNVRRVACLQSVGALVGVMGRRRCRGVLWQSLYQLGRVDASGATVHPNLANFKLFGECSSTDLQFCQFLDVRLW